MSEYIVRSNRCYDCRHVTDNYHCKVSEGDIDKLDRYVLGRENYLRCAEVRQALPDYSRCPLFKRRWRLSLELAFVAVAIAAGILAAAWSKGAL